MKKTVVNLRNARKGEYRKVIEEILARGKCPFCPENFKYHKKPILRSQGQWFLTENSWPYTNTRCHLILICKTHKERFSELTRTDFKNVVNLTNWAIEKYKISGGAVFVRFGNTNFTGASVAHLHFQIVVPKPKRNKKGTERVTVPVGG
ncbi:MAG: hypothetical protein HYS52_00095 [Candidatus Wildermuthbacteria bacterium]|nr:hypothetical protein [Candidatus Wildermuthbacteria bacterium]